MITLNKIYKPSIFRHWNIQVKILNYSCLPKKKGKNQKGTTYETNRKKNSKMIDLSTTKPMIMLNMNTVTQIIVFAKWNRKVRPNYLLETISKKLM